MGKKHYPIRIPRYASGIRAQETRAGNGRSWWSHEWMRRLETMGMNGRLGRGKNYALSGQVVSMAIDDGMIVASVVGTRPQPYEVSAGFRQLDLETHSRLVAELRREPMLVARLLADDLPTEVAQLFKAEGFDLFPGGKFGPGVYDVTTACTCPDYANPCKHTIAVLLLLGEEIACRPSTLLRLRGIDMEELYDED